jgi:hypothetical protein
MPSAMVCLKPARQAQRLSTSPIPVNTWDIPDWYSAALRREVWSRWEWEWWWPRTDEDLETEVSEKKRVQEWARRSGGVGWMGCFFSGLLAGLLRLMSSSVRRIGSCWDSAR